MRNIITIVGPTGTGKTSLALDVLQTIPGAIISADSRQVYKSLDYTTNKVSPTETFKNITKHDGFWVQDGVSIYGYDVATICDPFDVVQFIEHSVEICKVLWEENKVPIIVGGTGFYSDALLGRAPVSVVPPNLNLRKELRDYSLSTLHDQLFQLDRTAFESLDESQRNNPQKLIRYIEIITATGSLEAGQWWSPLKHELVPENTLNIGLQASRVHLYNRVDEWVEALVRSGYVYDETNCLLAADCDNADRLLRGVLFKEAAHFLVGEYSEAEMISRMKGRLHHYIRRQLMWFKRNNDIEWWDIEHAQSFSDRITSILTSWYDEGS